MSDAMSHARTATEAADKRALALYMHVDDEALLAECQRLYKESRRTEALRRAAEEEDRSAASALEDAERAYQLRQR